MLIRVLRLINGKDSEGVCTRSTPSLSSSTSHLKRKSLQGVSPRPRSAKRRISRSVAARGTLLRGVAGAGSRRPPGAERRKSFLMVSNLQSEGSNPVRPPKGGGIIIICCEKQLPQGHVFTPIRGILSTRPVQVLLVAAGPCRRRIKVPMGLEHRDFVENPSAGLQLLSKAFSSIPAPPGFFVFIDCTPSTHGLTVL